VTWSNLWVLVIIPPRRSEFLGASEERNQRLQPVDYCNSLPADESMNRCLGRIRGQAATNEMELPQLEETGLAYERDVANHTAKLPRFDTTDEKISDPVDCARSLTAVSVYTTSALSAGN